MDTCDRILINFLVFYPKGTIFLKSIDVLNAIKIIDLLYKLFREVVLMIDLKNVSHLVIDNVKNYVAIGKKLE